MRRFGLWIALVVIPYGCAQAVDGELVDAGGNGSTTSNGGNGGSGGKGGSTSSAGSGATTSTSGGTGGSGTGGSAGKGGSAGSTTGGSSSGGTSSGGTSSGGGGTGGTSSGGTGGTSSGGGGTGGTSAQGGSPGCDGGAGGSGNTGGVVGYTLKYDNENASTTSNPVGSIIRLYNDSGSTLNMAGVKIRYYFTDEVTASYTKEFNWCNAGPQNSLGGCNFGTKTVTVSDLACATANADSYIEFGFSSGTLPTGQLIEFSWDLFNTASQNWNQSNDYSYNSSTSEITWDHLVAYDGSTLLYGVEP